MRVPYLEFIFFFLICLKVVAYGFENSVPSCADVPFLNLEVALPTLSQYSQSNLLVENDEVSRMFDRDGRSDLISSGVSPAFSSDGSLGFYPFVRFDRRAGMDGLLSDSPISDVSLTGEISIAISLRVHASGIIFDTGAIPDDTVGVAMSVTQTETLQEGTSGSFKLRCTIESLVGKRVISEVPILAGEWYVFIVRYSEEDGDNPLLELTAISKKTDFEGRGLSWDGESTDGYFVWFSGVQVVVEDIAESNPGTLLLLGHTPSDAGVSRFDMTELWFVGCWLDDLMLHRVLLHSAGRYFCPLEDVTRLEPPRALWSVDQGVVPGAVAGIVLYYDMEVSIVQEASGMLVRDLGIFGLDGFQPVPGLQPESVLASRASDGVSTIAGYASFNGEDTFVSVPAPPSSPLASLVSKGELSMFLSARFHGSGNLVLPGTDGLDESAPSTDSHSGLFLRVLQSNIEPSTTNEDGDNGGLEVWDLELQADVVLRDGRMFSSKVGVNVGEWYTIAVRFAAVNTTQSFLMLEVASVDGSIESSVSLQPTRSAGSASVAPTRGLVLTGDVDLTTFALYDRVVSSSQGQGLLDSLYTRYQAPFYDAEAVATDLSEIFPLNALEGGFCGTEAVSLGDFSNIQVWYKIDESAIILSGATVVVDLSGNGRHTSQMTVEKMPLVRWAPFTGWPFLRFDGIDDSSSGSLPQADSLLGAADLSIVLVFRWTESGELVAVGSDSGFAIAVSARGGSNRIIFSAFRGGLAYQGSLPITQGTWYALLARWSTTGSRMDITLCSATTMYTTAEAVYADTVNRLHSFGSGFDTHLVPLNSTTMPYEGGLDVSPQLTIGRQSDVLDRFVRADIAELGIYTARLHDAEVVSAAAWLRDQYLRAGATDPSVFQTLRTWYPVDSSYFSSLPEEPDLAGLRDLSGYAAHALQDSPSRQPLRSPFGDRVPHLHFDGLDDTFLTGNLPLSSLSDPSAHGGITVVTFLKLYYSDPGEGGSLRGTPSGHIFNTGSCTRSQGISFEVSPSPSRAGRVTGMITVKGSSGVSAWTTLSLQAGFWYILVIHYDESDAVLEPILAAAAYQTSSVTLSGASLVSTHTLPHASHHLTLGGADEEGCGFAMFDLAEFIAFDGPLAAYNVHMVVRYLARKYFADCVPPDVTSPPPTSAPTSWPSYPETKTYPSTLTSAPLSENPSETSLTSKATSATLPPTTHPSGWLTTPLLGTTVHSSPTILSATTAGDSTATSGSNPWGTTPGWQPSTGPVSTPTSGPSTSADGESPTWGTTEPWLTTGTAAQTNTPVETTESGGEQAATTWATTPGWQTTSAGEQTTAPGTFPASSSLPTASYPTTEGFPTTNGFPTTQDVSSGVNTHPTPTTQGFPSTSGPMPTTVTTAQGGSGPTTWPVTGGWETTDGGPVASTSVTEGGTSWPTTGGLPTTAGPVDCSESMDVPSTRPFLWYDVTPLTYFVYGDAAVLEDLSGNDRHAFQVLPERHPRMLQDFTLGTHLFLSFDGIDDDLHTRPMFNSSLLDPLSTTPSSIYAVVRPRGGQVMFSTGGMLDHTGLYVSLWEQSVWVGAQGTAASSAVKAVLDPTHLRRDRWHLLTVLFDPASTLSPVSVSVDGVWVSDLSLVADPDADATQACEQSFTIGKPNMMDHLFGNMDVSEIVAYDVAVSEQTHDDLQCYFLHKYNLPSTNQ
eukprot:Rmarinus@m.21357